MPLVSVRRPSNDHPHAALLETAMPTAATMSDPQYTPQGALFPIVTIHPEVGGQATITISRPDGLDADAALTRDEVMNIRDYLTMILGDAA